MTTDLQTESAVAIPSILAQSERFYDLSGSLTYLSVTALSLYLPTLRARAAASLVGGVKPAWPSLLEALKGGAGSGPNALNWRQVVLSAAVAVWATRCATSPVPNDKSHFPFSVVRIEESSSEA